MFLEVIFHNSPFRKASSITQPHDGQKFIVNRSILLPRFFFPLKLKQKECKIQITILLPLMT